MNDLERINPVSRTGKVLCVTGPAVESNGPLASIGDLCRIQTREGHAPILAEVVGFRSNKVLLMPFGDMEGVQPGSAVTTEGKPLQIKMGFDLMGRVLNSLGEPIDGLGPIRGDCRTSLKAAPPHPMRRMRIFGKISDGGPCIGYFHPMWDGTASGYFCR